MDMPLMWQATWTIFLHLWKHARAAWH